MNNVQAMAIEETSVHFFKVKDIDGKNVVLKEYKGKVILIVNTA